MRSSMRMSYPRPRVLLGCVLCCLAVALMGSPAANAASYAYPDAEMMNNFVREWGTGTFAKADLPGSGVEFTVTLPDKMGVGDNYPVGAEAGLGPDGRGHNTSLIDYDGIEMLLTYTTGPAGSDIRAHLFMNTGLTGPSGIPSGDVTNDTFWSGEWVGLTLGQTVLLTLDFDAAEAWSISDNKVPHTGGGQNWADGGTYAINDWDRKEVSHLGLEFEAGGGVTGNDTVVLSLRPVPEPVTLVGLAAAIAGLGQYLRRRRRA